MKITIDLPDAVAERFVYANRNLTDEGDGLTAVVVAVRDAICNRGQIALEERLSDIERKLELLYNGKYRL